MAVLPPANLPGHEPVMLCEMLRFMAPAPGQTIIDATFGGGGYTRALLAAGAGTVLALDRDPDAVDRARELAAQEPRLKVVHARFGELDQVAATESLTSIDGIVFDLGVSSFQFDQAERGFSFRYDAPLDMRMDKEGQTVADLIASIGEVDLARLLWNFGDERDARRIARMIVAERQKEPISSTRQLADIVARAKGPSRELIDPATRTFQALRIAVNDELAELRLGLAAAEQVLRPGGRLVTVAFHSGEDAIVKDFINERGGRTRRVNRHLPSLPEEEPRWGWITDRPVRPEPAETDRNPRARSARLRSAIRLGPGVVYRGSERDSADTGEGER